MFLVNWRHVGFLLFPSAAIFACVAAFFLLGRTTRLLTVAGRIVAAAGMIAGLCGVMLFVLVGGDDSAMPVYSPQRDAVVVAHYLGGFGLSGTYVLMHTHHGLWMKNVATTDEIISPERMIWKDDHRLTIYYPRDAQGIDCEGSRAIQVTCVAEDVNPNAPAIPLSR